MPIHAWWNFMVTSRRLTKTAGGSSASCGPVLAILDLHVSPGSSIAVVFGAEKLTVKHNPLSDGRARLALSACPRSNHG